ncbi:MAG: class I tRNA ligase family protein [Candidatus Poribacteria bacterium]
MDYRKTLNLPKMSFPKIMDFVKVESETLNLWQSLNVYEKRLKNNKGKHKIFIHTPPQKAYGDINIINTFNMILKDIKIKYQLMKGDNVQHTPIWNFYCIEVEQEAIKDLDGKLNINLSESATNGNDLKFVIRNKCFELSTKYMEIQKGQFQKLGVFAHWDNSIRTSNPDYESEIIKDFLTLCKSDNIIKTPRSKFWCINCELEIDRSEIIYSGYDLLSIYVMFPIMQGFEEFGENVYMLVWTNAPWILSSVRPIAVNPDLEYSAIEIENDYILILANSIIDKIETQLFGNNYKVIKQMKGSELRDVICSHPLIDINLKVVMDKHVSIEKGTGCDYNISKQLTLKNYEINSFHLIDFEKTLGNGLQFYLDDKIFNPSNPIAIELEKRGYLFLSEISEQMYPHCLYCNQPLITKSDDHWHFDLSANHLRQKTIKSANNLEFFPVSLKKRIKHSIEKNTRWNISKKRIWGIPVPIFYCNKCEHQLDLDDNIELCNKIIEQKGINGLINIKSEDVHSYEIICDNCGSIDFRIESDVLSSEFISVLSYKNLLLDQKSKSDNINLLLKSNLHNGNWDALSLSASMAIDGELPFKSIVKYGTIKNANFPEKKSELKNFLGNFGADMIRLCISLAHPNRHLTMSEDYIKSLLRQHTNIRNVFRFMLGNLSEFDPDSDSVSYNNLHKIDKWILYKLNNLIEIVHQSYENFQFYRIYPEIYRFITYDLSKTYINIIRRRLYAFPKWSIGRRSIQTVFYQILTTIAKLITPILPFTSEELWSYIPNATDKHKSIYLSEFPKPEKAENLEESDNFFTDWDKILKIKAGIYKTYEKNRHELEIKNLSHAFITIYISPDFSDSDEIYRLLYKFVTEDILAEIFMVSKVQVMQPDSPIPDIKYDLEGFEGISIEIKPTTGSRCKRCLIYSITVGTSPLYPDLCDKCIAVLEGESAYA